MRHEGGVDFPIFEAGDDTLSLCVNSPHTAQSVADQLRAAGGWTESVAGTDSVLVQFDAAATDVAGARERLQRQLGAVSMQAEEGTAFLEVPVCYGGEFGPDFDSVCATLGLTRERLIALHTDAEYTVEMLGFTPGFAYVGGLSEALNVPRLGNPRLRVEAGSVGIAGSRSGLYALPGPGGWSLLGRTPLRLFDADATSPFTVTAGMRIRFRAIDVEEFRQMGGQ